MLRSGSGHGPATAARASWRSGCCPSACTSSPASPGTPRTLWPIAGGDGERGSGRLALLRGDRGLSMQRTDDARRPTPHQVRLAPRVLQAAARVRLVGETPRRSAAGRAGPVDLHPASQPAVDTSCSRTTAGRAQADREALAGRQADRSRALPVSREQRVDDRAQAVRGHLSGHCGRRSAPPAFRAREQPVEVGDRRLEYGPAVRSGEKLNKP